MTLPGRLPRTRYPLGIVVIVVLTALRAVTLVASLLDIHGSEFADWVRSGSPLPQPPPGSDFEVIARILIVGLLIASVLVVIGLLARQAVGVGPRDRVVRSHPRHRPRLVVERRTALWLDAHQQRGRLLSQPA